MNRRTFLSWLGTAMVALGVALPVRFGEEEPDDALPSWVNERPDQIFYLEPDKVPLKLLMRGGSSVKITPVEGGLQYLNSKGDTWLVETVGDDSLWR